MARIIDAFKQFDYPGGSLEFLDNRTPDKKDTFSDIGLSLVNTNPVILDGEGFCPNVFGESLYTINLRDKNGTFITGFNDVLPGGSSGTDAFAFWTGSITYILPAYVTGSDDCIYKAIQSSENLDPVTDDGSTWIKKEFIEFYSEFITYKVNQKVKVTGDKVYISSKSGNLNNEPVGDDGTNWQLDNALLVWVKGRTYLVGEDSLGSDGITYKAVISQSGNNPVGDSGTNWRPTFGIVTKPVNLAPVVDAIGVSRNPTLNTNPYEVLGSDSGHEWTRYTLRSSDLITLIYDSGITRDLEEHDVTLKLDAATVFSYQAEMKGSRTEISEFSTATEFTTVFPLSSSFDNSVVTGTGAARSLITQVDLNSMSGLVMISNGTAGDTMRICSTLTGVGNAFLAGTTVGLVSEVTGLTSFDTVGYSVGTDAAYNGSGNTIFSLIFQQIAKFADLVQYTGNQTIRTLGHGLNAVPGTIISFPEGTTILARVRYDAGTTSLESFTFANIGASATNTTYFTSTAATSTTFTLGIGQETNKIGVQYLALLLANDKAAGIVSGFYNGSGVPGNKVVTEFVTSTVFAKSTSSGEWYVFDREMGVSSHLLLNNSPLILAGGLQSFDTDGFTLSSLANVSGQTFYYIAIADKDLF